MDNKSFLQWNCRGIREKKNELSDLVFRYQPNIICLQETKLRDTVDFRLSNYIVHRKDNSDDDDVTAHGGVAILVKNSLSCSLCRLNTDLQAIAVKVFIGRLIYICCIYLPPNVRLEIKDLDNLIHQLPRPFIIMGDFNAHNPIWGSSGRNRRGNDLENCFNLNNMN